MWLSSLQTWTNWPQDSSWISITWCEDDPTLTKYPTWPGEINWISVTWCENDPTLSIRPGQIDCKIEFLLPDVKTILHLVWPGWIDRKIGFPGHWLGVRMSHTGPIWWVASVHHWLLIIYRSVQVLLPYVPNRSREQTTAKRTLFYSWMQKWVINVTVVYNVWKELGPSRMNLYFVRISSKFKLMNTHWHITICLCIRTSFNLNLVLPSVVYSDRIHWDCSNRAKNGPGLADSYPISWCCFQKVGIALFDHKRGEWKVLWKQKLSTESPSAS